MEIFLLNHSFLFFLFILFALYMIIKSSGEWTYTTYLFTILVISPFTDNYFAVFSLWKSPNLNHMLLFNFASLNDVSLLYWVMPYVMWKECSLQLKAWLDLGSLGEVMKLTQPQVSWSLSGATDLSLRAVLEKKRCLYVSICGNECIWNVSVKGKCLSPICSSSRLYVVLASELGTSKASALFGEDKC